MANKHYVSNKDESIRLFKNPILDAVSYVYWYTPLIVWLPIISWCLYYSIAHYSAPLLPMAGVFFVAIFVWTFMEYILHRFVFHFHPKGKLMKRLHFVMHGVHHDYPNDSKRLVMPPALSIVLALPFIGIFYAIFGDSYLLYTAFAGFVFGYLIYDMMHYALHYAKITHPYFLKLKHHHMIHHYHEPHNGFGVSNMFWDKIFGTSLDSMKKDN